MNIVFVVTVAFYTIAGLAVYIWSITAMADAINRLLRGVNLWEGIIPKRFVNLVQKHRSARIAALALAPLLHVAFRAYLLTYVVFMEAPDEMREAWHNIRRVVASNK